MTGVSRHIEYPLLVNCLLEEVPALRQLKHIHKKGPLNFFSYSQQNLITSPSQTPSVWFPSVCLIIAKDRSVYDKHLALKNQLIRGR